MLMLMLVVLVVYLLFGVALSWSRPSLFKASQGTSHRAPEAHPSGAQHYLKPGAEEAGHSAFQG